MRKLAVLAFLTACAPEMTLDVPVTKADDVDGDGKADSSVEATILDFEVTGEVVSNFDWAPEDVVREQLFYSIGELNASRAVGRLDRLELLSVSAETLSGGRTRLSYKARLPVAWGSKTDLPSTYTFKLPRDVSESAMVKFVQKYGTTCVSDDAHGGVDVGSLWYYYRPRAAGCSLAGSDVTSPKATISVSTSNTTGKFPEYGKVWEDNALRVVAIFGKYEDGTTTSSDPGIAAYNKFVTATRTALPGATATPSFSGSPGVSRPDVQIDATLADGRKVQVVSLLVDNVRDVPAWFDPRYTALSTRADVVMYHGHAGLGANVRELARKGAWTSGQYLILFMNGCDTYAYVDGYLADARAAVNPDDPGGTKYLDIVTNAMPAYFQDMAGAGTALWKGLLDVQSPRTYEQIFKQVSRDQVVLVSGEEDNVFVPGGAQPPGDGWPGLEAAGAVVKNQEVRWTTPVLPAGTYRFDLTGTGDADLYVRQGTAPTTTVYDCRPYKSGSVESCVVEVGTPSTVHVMVRGYAASSTYELVGGED